LELTKEPLFQHICNPTWKNSLSALIDALPIVVDWYFEGFSSKRWLQSQ
jgi:hypothetical protein